MADCNTIKSADQALPMASQPFNTSVLSVPTSMETPDLSSYIETIYRCKVCQFLGDTSGTVTEHLKTVHFSQGLLGSLDHSYAGEPQGAPLTEKRHVKQEKIFDDSLERQSDNGELHDDDNDDDDDDDYVPSDDDISIDDMDSSADISFRAPKKNYRCSTAGCRLRFPSQEQKALHEQCHVPEGEASGAPFRCPTCQVEESTWEGMMVHLGTHTCLFHLYCVVCNDSFPGQDDLDTHLAAEHGVNHPQWPPHYKQVHTWRFNLLKKKFGCLRKDCKSYFFNQEELEVHQKCHIDKEPYFKCYICLQCYTTWPSMKTHLLQCHGQSLKVEHGRKVDSETNMVHEGQKDIGNGNQENRRNRRAQGYIRQMSWFRCKREGCMVKYRTKEQLELHDRCHLTGRDSLLFQCPFCKTETTDWEAMRAHLTDHTDLLYLTCEACHLRFPTMEQLDQHFNKQHFNMKTTSSLTLQQKQKLARRSLERRKRKYKCENRFCKKIFFFKEEDLHIHEQCHIENSPDFRCCIQNCARAPHMFNKWIKLRDHLASAHNVHIAARETGSTGSKPKKNKKDKKDNHPTMCDICGKVLRGRRNLRGHMRQHKEPLRCSQCPKFSTRCPQTHRAHMEKHQGQGRFQCKECGYFAPLESHLKRHMEVVHSEDKPYMCDLCGKCFKALGNLNNHTRVMHSDARPYACPKCDYTCKSKGGLWRHDKNIHSEDRVTCPLCGFSTCTASVLEKHMDLHSDDRQHKCPHCTYGFKDSNALKRHIEEIHSERHQHHCRVCSYSTNNHIRMEEHTLSHLDMPQYSCDICTFKTKWRTSLFRHYQSVHNIKKPVVKLAKVSAASDSSIQPRSSSRQMAVTSQNTAETSVTVPVTSTREADGATAILMGLAYGAGNATNMEEYVVNSVDWSSSV